MRHKKSSTHNSNTNNEWIKNSPIKRIQAKAPYVIELADGNYLQMLEIRGKDLYAMGESETNRTVLNYYNWLTDFNIFSFHHGKQINVSLDNQSE